MLYATVDGVKRTAEPKLKGVCPDCQGEMISKCGSVMPWHWAHRELTDCDPWYEGETAWHLSWKAKFPVEFSEISIVKNGVRHRADVQFPSGAVFEIQHSSISPEDIQAREEFYGEMAWLFDAREAYASERLYINRDKGSYLTYRWKFPRRTITSCHKPVFLQVDDSTIWRLLSMHADGQCYGACVQMDKEQWLCKFCLAHGVQPVRPKPETFTIGSVKIPTSFCKRAA